MRFIFSKAGLALLLLMLAGLWVGGEVLKQPIQASSKTMENIETSPAATLQNNPQDTSPEIVRWIVETTQPIASELRSSLNNWWSGMKVNISNYLIQWLAQQQQNISSSIQTQLFKIINKALGVNPVNSQ